MTTHTVQTDGAEIAALRERATQAQQEARSAGRFSRRRAERDTQTATSEWEQARDRATQRWGSAPWGAGEVESWAERVSQQRAGQDPQVRDASKASTVAKIELNTAHKRHPLEAQGLARRVFRNDPAAQFLTAESGERRAAQNTERWRGRATDLRAEAVELRQLPTDQAAERVQAKHPDVLGCLQCRGLVAGLQVVKPGTREPDADTATKINVACFQRGLLMFAPVGVAGECLKISPPLSIPEEMLAESLQVFEEACDAVLG